MKLLLITLITFKTYSIEVYKNDIVDRVSSKKSAPKRSKVIKRSKNYKKLYKQTKKELEAKDYILSMISNKPMFLSDSIIGEGDLISAMTSYTVRATNQPSQIMLQNLKGAGLPKNAKLRCSVISKYKRVCGKCNRLIIDGKGFEIDATLNNKDGSHCVVGNISDNKELYITSTITSNLASSALILGQTRNSNLLGQQTNITTSNAINQALANSASNLNDSLSDELKTKEPIVVVPKNEYVIVQFNKGLKL